jgi:hypothetical protein
MQDLILGQQQKENTSCWRVKGAQRICDGNAAQIDPWIRIPVLLALTVEPSCAGSNIPIPSQTFPSILTLKDPSAEKPFYYDMAALVSHHGYHFQTHFQTNGSVYVHDGLLHNGFAVRVANISLVNSLDTQSPGSSVSLVLYRLRGGQEDLMRFEKIAQCRIQLEHGILLQSGCDKGDDEVFLRKKGFVSQEDAWRAYRDVPFLSERREYVMKAQPSI